jgi:cysteinyl-tRNA synthetase
MHNGFLTMIKEKMAKSVGNIVTARELLDNHRGEAIRLALLSAQYRQPLDWSDDTVDQAQRRLDGLYDVLDHLSDIPDEDVPPPTNFMDALTDDVNTPRALAVLSEMASAVTGKPKVKDPAKTKNEIRAAGKILGLLQEAPDTWLRAGPDRVEIQEMIGERESARKAKDFEAADALRGTLTARGIEVRDRTGASPRWFRRKAPNA